MSIQNIPLGGGAVHYSTEEIVIGTWIDGKPLYQRTFTGATNTSGENTQVTSLNGATVFGGECVLFVNSSTFVDEGDMLVIPFSAGQGSSTNFAWYVTNKILYLSMPNSSYRNKAYAITLRYTKTTD